MDERVRGIVERCRRVLEDHYGSRFAGLIVYGSSARGDTSTQSDVDLLVLMKGSFDYFRELWNLTDLLYPLQLDSERLLSAKPASTEEFESGRTQMYRNAKREGVRI